MILKSIKFWIDITKGRDKESLTYDCYLYLFSSLNNSTSNDNWLQMIKKILMKLGCLEEWDNQFVNNKKIFLKIIKIELTQCYKMQWKNFLFNDIGSQNGNKLRTYRIFKSEFSYEPYLDFLDNQREKRIAFTKLRTSAHKLNIEQGRYKKVPLEDRLCSMCNILEDEFHFVLKCKINETLREDMIRNMIEIFPDFSQLSDDEKFWLLMSLPDYDVVKIISKFIFESMKIRENIVIPNKPQK